MSDNEIIDIHKEMLSMQLVHSQTKHPRGSSPHEQSDYRMNDRVGSLRSIEQAPEDLSTTSNSPDGRQLARQFAEPTTDLTAQESGPDWQQDKEGR
jgi:hypothetical protein